MSKGLILRVTGIMVFACFLACERVPQNAIDDARTALEMAEKSGGRSWAPTQLTQGHIFYDSAMKEVALEKRKLPFKRSYKKATDLLDLAGEAGHFTLETMQTARSNCKDMLDKAKGLADTAEDRLAVAAANNMDVKGLHAALDSVKIAQKDALALLDSANLHFAEEQTMTAFDKTVEVVKKITDHFSALEKTVQ